MASSTVSIIILSWNSGRHLPICLIALSKQSFKDFNVILVDNNSTDNLADVLKDTSSDISLVLKKLDTNQGFAIANNIGARFAKGEWIVLLNADAYPEPDWLEKLLKAAEQNPQYNFFSSRQIAVSRDLIGRLQKELPETPFIRELFAGIRKMTNSEGMEISLPDLK